SKRLITMLSLLDKQLKRQAYTFRDKYDERRLKIGANIVTMLVERETTVLLQCEGQLHSYTRVATLPNFHLLSQMRTDAITLRFARHDGMSGVYGSSQHALLIWERSVYVFSKREQQLAMILQLLTDLGGEVTYRGEHIRFFYEQVLPLIGPYVQDPEHVTITKNPTDTLAATLQISFDECKQLQAVIQYTYGAHQFDGGYGSVEGFLLQQEIIDYGLETKMQAAGFELESNRLLLVDETLMYEFLCDELPTLAQTYRVEVSSELNDWSKVGVPKATLGVRVENELLKVDVAQLQFSLADYQAIATKYRLKKTYHRLDNGQFVNLATPGMQAVMQILEQLDVNAADIASGEIVRNQYEALFLQESLQQSHVKA
ncbi:MAG: SNF2 helicase associated domain-containing protein, partial [Culicoidibacterales bacterium]